MSRDQRGQVGVPTAKQHRRPAIIKLQKPKPAILGRDLHSESSHSEKLVDVLLRNLAGAIDLVGIDIRFQILAELLQEWIALNAIFVTLRGIRKDPREIALTDKQVAGETAPFVQWITGGFCEFQRFPLTFRHF